MWTDRTKGNLLGRTYPGKDTMCACCTTMLCGPASDASTPCRVPPLHTRTNGVQSTKRAKFMRARADLGIFPMQISSVDTHWCTCIPDTTIHFPPCFAPVDTPSTCKAYDIRSMNETGQARKRACVAQPEQVRPLTSSRPQQDRACRRARPDRRPPCTGPLDTPRVSSTRWWRGRWWRSDACALAKCVCDKRR